MLIYLDMLKNIWNYYFYMAIYLILLKLIFPCLQNMSKNIPLMWMEYIYIIKYSILFTPLCSWYFAHKITFLCLQGPRLILAPINKLVDGGNCANDFFFSCFASWSFNARNEFFYELFRNLKGSKQSKHALV